MNLNKTNWTRSAVRDVAFEVSERVENPSLSGLQRFVGLEEFEAGEFRIRKWVTTENLVSAMKLFKSGDILFARRNAYLRRTSEVDFDGICSGDAIVLRSNQRSAIRFLTLLLNTDKFWEFAIANAAGTMSKRVKWRDLAEYNFLLPPLDEQERIVELFQSIEQSIIQTEGQEKNLKSLQKTLSNGLVSDPPVFGNLLTGKTSEVFKTSEVSFGKIVECVEEHDRTPLEHELTRFVGLENIEAENFTLQGFGNIEDGTTFTKRFSKGDVLFGKRRAYLKKVAIADYDGICSSDILVFRAIKDEILPELLPYYVSSDAFINHAVTTSAGSLSPRTKWRDLAGFQLSVPDVKIQEKMVDVFNQLSQSLQLLGKQKETLKKLKQKLLNEILG